MLHVFNGGAAELSGVLLMVMDGAGLHERRRNARRWSKRYTLVLKKAVFDAAALCGKGGVVCVLGEDTCMGAV